MTSWRVSAAGAGSLSVPRVSHFGVRCCCAVERRAEESRFQFRQLSQHPLQSPTLPPTKQDCANICPHNSRDLPAIKDAKQGKCGGWSVRAQPQGP